MQNTILSGRRKTSVARVYFKPGTGNFTINDKSIENYFPVPTNQMSIKFPLTITDTVNKYDIFVNVNGGGTTGQADAIRLAISKILCEENAENRAILKPHGLLTRDSRMVERKKPGQKKARKRFQFSKR